MIKLLATLVVTAGFAFGIYSLPGGCWPCCSFLAWTYVIACIWETENKNEEDENDGGNIDNNS